MNVRYLLYCTALILITLLFAIFPVPVASLQNGTTTIPIANETFRIAYSFLPNSTTLFSVAITPLILPKNATCVGLVVGLPSSLLTNGTCSWSYPSCGGPLKDGSLCSDPQVVTRGETLGCVSNLTEYLFWAHAAWAVNDGKISNDTKQMVVRAEDTTNWELSNTTLLAVYSSGNADSMNTQFVCQNFLPIDNSTMGSNATVMSSASTSVSGSSTSLASVSTGAKLTNGQTKWFLLVGTWILLRAVL